MFVVAVSAILEGERGYHEQTLATPILQTLHVLRGVVNMFLVNVKVQGVTSFLNERQTSGLYMHQKLIRAQPNKLRFCISLFCEVQDRIPYKYASGLDRTMTCKSCGLFAMR